MALREVKIWPDPALEQIASPVKNFDDELKQLVADMFETMYHENGVGLAATQIAVPLRVLVIDLDPRREAETDKEYAQELKEWGFKEPLAFINPEIIKTKGSIVWPEGCLSVPTVTVDVTRNECVTVRAYDKDGTPFEVHATGLFAVALQHEIDHLDGKVFVTYVSRLKRDVILRKMKRLKTSQGPHP